MLVHQSGAFAQASSSSSIIIIAIDVVNVGSWSLESIVRDVFLIIHHRGLGGGGGYHKYVLGPKICQPSKLMVRKKRLSVHFPKEPAKLDGKTAIFESPH